MKHDDMLKEARERMDMAVDFDRDNREAALEDLEFLAGGERQWPEEVVRDRIAEQKPIITINRLPQFVRQVTGDIRKLNPAVKVSAGDNEANKATAELIEGLVRGIEHKCEASSIYEGAAESAASCSMGAFRVLTEYADDTSFNQDILIKRIHNPFAVYWDPRARESTREDARFCFITDQMTMDDFQNDYPDAQPVDVKADATTDYMEHWHNSGDVVVAEYYWKESEEVEIGLLRDGTVIEKPQAIHDAVKKRTTQREKVMWAKISGKEVLEGPQRVAGKHIPVVAVMGEELHLGDEVYRTSVIRHAKDPQRLYNYWTSTHTELVALQPKAPYLVTTKQVAGLEGIWAKANTANRPYLPYNPDEKSGMPQRSAPPQPSAGIMQEAQKAAEDMKATTGIYDAGLGAQSNEKSGVAIRQRQMEADISTSIYTDNLAKSITQCGRIIVGMIPEIYDTQRIVRILGDDGQEELTEINGVQMGDNFEVEYVNPIRPGKYDVQVSVGPNYSTRRQETQEGMMQFVQAVPAAGQVAGDLIAKAMDWPDADKLADRLKKMLPPGMIDEKDMDPEEMQSELDQMGQIIQQLQQQMEQMAQEPEMRKAQAEATEAEADAMEAGADAEKAALEVQEKQLQLAATTGQLDEAIAQIVQAEVARALQGMMQP